jgi:hypothetical protein
VNTRRVRSVIHECSIHDRKSAPYVDWGRKNLLVLDAKNDVKVYFMMETSNEEAWGQTDYLLLTQNLQGFRPARFLDRSELATLVGTG